MALTRKEASCFIVLGMVISVVTISWIILKDGHQVHFKQNSEHTRRGANQASLIVLKHPSTIHLHPSGHPNTISNSTSHNIFHTISENISNFFTDSNPKANSEATSMPSSDHSHSSIQLEDGGHWQWHCEAVSNHLSCCYVAQINLSISSHICIQIVLGRNVWDCSFSVDSFLVARNQWLWMRDHNVDSWDAKLVQQLWYLSESQAVYSKGIVFGIGHGLCSWHLLSRSPDNHSSEGDGQSTFKLAHVQASSIVLIDITSNCTFWFSSECSSECSPKCSPECSSECSSDCFSGCSSECSYGCYAEYSSGWSSMC